MSLSEKLAELEKQALAAGVAINAATVDRFLTAAERKLVDHHQRRGLFESGVRATQIDQAA